MQKEVGGEIVFQHTKFPKEFHKHNIKLQKVFLLNPGRILLLVELQSEYHSSYQLQPGMFTASEINITIHFRAYRIMRTECMHTG